MKVEPSQLSLASMNAICRSITEIESMVRYGEKEFALVSLAELKTKILNIRTVPSRLVEVPCEG